MSRTWTIALAGMVLACNSTPDRGKTVLFASGADLQSMNPLITVHPLAKQVQKYVLLTTLARYDSTLIPRPYLATDWSWSNERTVLALNLHSGLLWDDGAPTTAHDVAWTLETARLPATGYPRLADLADFDRIEALDDSTVVVTFGRPQQAFPDVLTDIAILPARHFADVSPENMRRAPWNEDPVGNGPFRFVSHEPNRRWVFQAKADFPDGLGGPPALSRFIVVVVDEPTTKLAALTAEELDFAGISPAHAEFVRRDDRLMVADYPLLFTYGMVFNTRVPLLNDLTLRQAVSLALDRQEIVDGYIFGFGAVATGPVPPGVPGRLPPPPAIHDPDSARVLLAGREVHLELLTVGSGDAPLEQMIQAQLTDVGFDVTIRQLELSAFLDRVYGPVREFEVAVMGIPGDLALGYLGPLLDLAGQEPIADPREAQRRLQDSLAVVFLYHARGVQGRNRRVREVVMDLRGELPTVADWAIVDSLPAAETQ
ncbi:MAG: ABC transporter substrate-binding protein [Gemmatimonadales bacterium]